MAKSKNINISELKKFKTFSAQFFLETNPETREQVYALSDSEIEELTLYLLQSKTMTSFVESKIGTFKGSLSKEKKLQAISYFIDNKERFLKNEQEKFDQILQKRENLLSNAAKIHLKK